jgi:hypothetical protein
MWQRVVGAAVLLASAAGQGAAMVVPVDIPEDWWLTNLLSNMFTCVCLVSCSPLKNDCVCVCVCVLCTSHPTSAFHLSYKLRLPCSGGLRHLLRLVNDHVASLACVIACVAYQPASGQQRRCLIPTRMFIAFQFDPLSACFQFCLWPLLADRRVCGVGSTLHAHASHLFCISILTYTRRRNGRSANGQYHRYFYVCVCVCVC